MPLVGSSADTHDPDSLSSRCVPGIWFNFTIRGYTATQAKHAKYIPSTNVFITVVPICGKTPSLHQNNILLRASNNSDNILEAYFGYYVCCHLSCPLCEYSLLNAKDPTTTD